MTSDFESDGHISIVVPTFNESASLPELVSRLDKVLGTMSEPYELLVVDDGSTDDTWETLSHVTMRWGKLRGIRLARNFGKEAAICAGLNAAEGSAVIVMDADLQHPPELLSQMIDIWRTKAVPIVEAVKESRQPEAVSRRVGARLFYFIFREASGLDLRQTTDFKLLDRRVVRQYLSLPERARFFRGLTSWFGFPRAVVPFTPPERPTKAGDSRWSFGRLLSLARQSLIAFTDVPLHLVTWLGLITFVVSLGLGLLTLWRKWQGQAVEGFTTVILGQLGIGSVLMISLGLIGEYLARVYEEVKGRPLYVISEVRETEEPRSAEKASDPTSLEHHL